MYEDFILIESDPVEILKEALEQHEELTGIKLPEAHKTTYIYSTIAALIANIKAEMNQVAMQNYLDFAKNLRLDLKGELYGTRGKRLLPNTARTTMRCYISTIVEREVIIPAGTRFLYTTFVFATENEYKILPGELYVDVPVVCETAGNLGKILIGEIKEITDKYDYFESCENITEVTGGRDEEEDDAYRERIRELPESFTSAGSEGAYKFWVKNASSLVTDVVIKSPQPNDLQIYVCNNTETISDEEKQKIKEYLEQDDIKALNDKITIKDPEIHKYNIKIEYWIYKNSRTSTQLLEEKLKNKLQEFMKSKKIGESLNSQDIITICKENADIKKVNIIEPADLVTEDVALCVGEEITLTFRGSEER